MVEKYSLVLAVQLFQWKSDILEDEFSLKCSTNSFLNSSVLLFS